MQNTCLGLVHIDNFSEITDPKNIKKDKIWQTILYRTKEKHKNLKVSDTSNTELNKYGTYC